MSSPARLAEQYERLRACVLARDASSGARLGQGVVAARGMAAWMQVVGELAAGVSLVPPSAPPGHLVSVPASMRRDLIQLLGRAVLTLVDRGAL